MFATAQATAASAVPPEPGPSTAVLGDTLMRGQQLTEDQSLQSPNGLYRLSLHDGSLYVLKAPNRLAPKFHVQGRLFGEDGTGTRLVMQEDSNLVFYKGDRALASTGTRGLAAFGLVMQDDGNVVLYDAHGTVMANFATYAQDALSAGGTLLPGESLRQSDGDTVLGMQTDGNLVLRTKGKAVFNTGTQGNPGAAAIQQSDGNFVVYAKNGTPLFDTGSSTTPAGDPTAGDLTVATVGPSDFRVEVRVGDSVVPPYVSLYGTSWTSSTVLPGQELQPGDRRVTSNGGQLILQTDGNLVQYEKGRAVFVKNNVFQAQMRADGNFVAERYTGGGLSTVFTTRSAGNPGSRLVLQDDGNLVVYTPQDKPVYSRK